MASKLGRDIITPEPWALATRERKFTYQQCDNCGTVVWYPRAHCTGCTTGALQWQTSAGEGTIYTFSIVRQSYHPFFRGEVPYVVAYVDLDEGVRFLTNVVGVDADAVRVGQRVRLEWETHDALNVPLVTPA